MKIGRKLLIPAIAAGAILAGTPAALAASAVSPPVAAPAAARPASGPHWELYNSYPTMLICRDNGNVITFGSGLRWKCVKTEEYGYEWVYDLYLWAG